MLEHKSACVDLIIHLFAFICTKFNACVKDVSTDNSKELCEGNTLVLFQHLGIEYQNGVVERKHKHLLERARALYFQSNVPPQFWGECNLMHKKTYKVYE